MTAPSPMLALVPGTHPVPDMGANTGVLAYLLGTYHLARPRHIQAPLFGTLDGAL